MRALIRPVAVATAALTILAGSVPAALARPGTVAHAPERISTSRAVPSGQPASVATAPLTCPCDLYAREGSLSLPGAGSTDILGLATSPGGDPTLPGPIIEVNKGATVSIRLHNELTGTDTASPDWVSLAFPGQSGVSFDASTMTYTFSASREGTFLYEAGLATGLDRWAAGATYAPDDLIVPMHANGHVYRVTISDGAPVTTEPEWPTGHADTVTVDGVTYQESYIHDRGPRQVAMGLFGALIVRDGTAAYGNAFDVERVLVVNGLDRTVNNAYPADPNLGAFSPRYWLVNGLAYPGTDTPATRITAEPGDRVLLRVINAGLQEESVGIMGLRQSIIATDGVPGPVADVTAQTVPPGGSIDSIVALPSSSVDGDEFLVMSASGHIFNGSPTGSTIPLGGFVQPIEVNAPPSIVEPVSVEVLPTGTAVRLTAAASDAATGASAIVGGEWFADRDPGQGAGTPMTATPTGPATATLAASVDVSRLAAGTHTLGVRARDARGNWSSARSVSIRVAKILYQNGFNRGLGRWSSVVGATRLTASAAAALDGARGLRVRLAGTRAAYLVDGSPNALRSYRARFLFDPRSAVTDRSTMVFVGRDTRARNLFRIQFRNLRDGSVAMRPLMLTNKGEVAGPWIRMASARHRIEVSWSASRTGSTTLVVDGQSTSSVRGYNAAYRLDRVLLGAVSGMSSTSTGRFDMDAFASTAGPPFVR